MCERGCGCEFCGNDDAAYCVCPDCLTGDYTTVIANALAELLGGQPTDEPWPAIAAALNTAISEA